MKDRFEDYELVAFLRDYADDFDYDAIRDEVTKRDPLTGNLYWRDIDTDELNAICQKYDKTAD